MRSRVIAQSAVFICFLALVLIFAGIITLSGCAGGGRKAKIIVPTDLHSFVGELLETTVPENADSDFSLPSVLSYEEDTALSSLIDDADISVIWWSRVVEESAEAGDLAVLSMDTIAPDGSWPESLLAFLRPISGSTDRLIGFPLSIDPWVMIWNRDYLAEYGAPVLWEALTGAAGPVFGLAGSAPDARLGWAALFADAYPSPDGAAALAPWKNGLQRLARAQSEGIIQRASFSYPWSDAAAIVKRGDVGAIFAPLSFYRSFDGGTQAALEVKRPPDALGRSNFALFADVLIAVVRSKSIDKMGVQAALQALAETAAQRTLADLLGTIPARIDAPVRDSAAFTAVRIARTAAYFQPLPGAALSDDITEELSELSLLLLKNPSNAEAQFSDHGL